MELDSKSQVTRKSGRIGAGTRTLPDDYSWLEGFGQKRIEKDKISNGTKPKTTLDFEEADDRDGGNTRKAPSKISKSVCTKVSSKRSLIDIEKKRIALETEKKIQSLKNAQREEEIKLLEMERDLHNAVLDAIEQNSADSIADKTLLTYDLKSKRVEDWVYSLNDSRPAETHSEPEILDRNYEDSREKEDSNKNNDLKLICDTVIKAIQAVSTSSSHNKSYLHKEFPVYDGKPEEWPLFDRQFKTVCKLCNFTDEEIMIKLQKSLKGAAKSAVSDMLLTTDNVDLIMHTLEVRFGRPELVINGIINKVKSMPFLKDSNLEKIIQFSTELNNMVSVMKTLKSTGHLQNPQLLSDLLKKLPDHLKLKWGKKISKTEKFLDLEDFAKWVGEMAKAACYVSTPITPCMDIERNVPKLFLKKPERVCSTIENERSSETKCRYCDLSGHTENGCPTMKNDPVDTRWKMVTSKKLCFCCLKRNHQKFKCRLKKQCQVHGCKLDHHPLLHKEIIETTNVNQTTQEIQSRTDGGETVCTIQAATKKVYLRAIPIILHGPHGSAEILALCDECSTISLLSKTVAQKIGLSGPRQNLCLQWTTENITFTEEDSIKVDLNVSKVGSSQRMFTIKGVRTTDNLSLPRQTVRITDMQKYEHLKHLPLRNIENEEPVMIIGQDNIDLIVPRRIRYGPENSLMASKCKLGWAVHGPNNESNSEKSSEQVNQVIHIHEQLNEYEEDDENLQEMVKNSYATESFGVLVTPNRLSSENSRALRVMEETIRKYDDRYEIGLLWRGDDVRLPESRTKAIQRLECIERKCRRNEMFGIAYSKNFNYYKEKGYFKKLTAKEAADEGPKTWYIPHFAVENVNKKKLRLVMDCASKSHGTSLNDNLLAGPDLLNSLVAILWKFRQYRFGFCGDVKEMFHQVRIQESDRQAQRVLWRDLDLNGEPEIYEMTVMTFGATCSPVCAQFVKNYHAITTVNDPKLKEAILKKFYVDDYLDSTATKGEAIRTITDICSAMKQAGFEVVNWMGNSSVISENFQEISAASKCIGDKTTVQRVLGLYWDTEDDSFLFRLKIKEDILEKAPTKRTVLKTVMSIYDPLGLISCFSIKAKILMQDIWRSGIAWDENIPQRHMTTWKNWIKELPEVTKLRIPRCYSFKIPSATRIELHTYCDSSEKAFAAVSYLRVVGGPAENVDVSLVSSKTRVSPLKVLSIPRLELQAAVMASRLAEVLKSELEILIHQVYFWTDSRCVLSWIRSDSRNYKQFVSHRIGEIQERTNVEDWRWVPTEQNPADEATRSKFHANKLISDVWFQGPEFLRETEEFWPVEDRGIPETQENDPECKEKVNSCFTVIEKENYLPDISRFSNWLRLVRSTAWCQRFISIIKGRKDFPKELLVEELQKAESLWIKESQLQSFGKEVRQLQQGKAVSIHSRLRNLCPQLENGLLVLGGRTNMAENLDKETKFPYILDPKHPYSKLIIRWTHEKLRHIGTETVLNHLRLRYWILNGRTAVKSVCSKCVRCQLSRKRPQPPLMGQLPEVRLKPEIKPFTNVGMDYFGPIFVKIGRRQEKRWGVIFTCLSVRAIHLEIAHTLNSDSTIMSILRMTARRGPIRTIYCDNGSNLRCASKEIKEALDNIDQSALKDSLSARGIDFHFIPPSAPHMAGVWERLIGSVKRTIGKILHDQSLREETLQTLFAEAEVIVNSRPLTRLSSDALDPEPLTPNHFLFGTPNDRNLTFLPINPDANSLRREWKKSRMLATSFWERWTKEYLPSLTKRNKWTSDHKSIATNDMVILVDDQEPRYKWKLARVTATYPGPDGRVRVIDLKTANGNYRRPVSKIFKLELEES